MWIPSTLLHPSNLQIVVFLFTFLPSIRMSPDSISIRNELTSRKLICEGLDSCRDNRTSDSLLDYNCHCGSFCRDLDTCCYDSPYKRPSGPIWRQVPRFVPKCLTVYGTPGYLVFMVDSCTRNDSFVRDMCASNGEDMGDPFLAVPVTSLRTGITYKNYYCAVCNKNPLDGQVAFWNVAIRSSLKTLSNPMKRDLTYDSTQRSWTMESDEGISTPVTLTMQVPHNLQQEVKTCRSGRQVSQCSPRWKNASIAEKCSAYTALVSSNFYGEWVRYKNPHCAICNYQGRLALDCQDRIIKDKVPTSGGAANRQEYFFVGLFVLEEEKQKNKCSGDMVYDGLSKKCRTGRCPRDHTLKNLKCVPDHS